MDEGRTIRAALDKLPIGVLDSFRPLVDFDEERLRDSYGAVGMTAKEFTAYYLARTKGGGT
jgi:hypothetical protein